MTDEELVDATEAVANHDGKFLIITVRDLKFVRGDDEYQTDTVDLLAGEVELPRWSTDGPVRGFSERYRVVRIVSKDTGEILYGEGAEGELW